MGRRLKLIRGLIRAFCGLVLACLVLAPMPVHAQAKPKPSDVYLYQGADREAKLIAEAKKESELPTVYNYKAGQLKNKGATIEWFAIPPAIARANGAGTAKNAPHPHAAVLYIDFMLSDAQPWLLQRDIIPTNKKVETSLNKMPLRFVDPKVMLDELDKWTKLYEEIITKHSR